MKSPAFVLALLLITGCTSTEPKELANSAEQGQENALQEQLCFAPACFTYETASSPEQQQQGLMFRESLPELHGMLFPFRKPYIPSFWMKNMRISLDIIWLDEELGIADISESIPPCVSELCPTYSPSVPVAYAFEVNAGTAESHSLSKGMKGTFTR